MDKQLIISLGREYGSGGHEIAKKLAEHYGLPLYDHNLLDEVCKEKHLSVEELSEYDETKKIRLFDRKVRGLSTNPEDNVAKLQFDFLKNKAAAGESFVVVGRCAEWVLKDCPALVTFFICGDKETKVQRIMDLHNLSRHDAEVFCNEKDRRRKAYHNSHAELHWGDSRNYEICINSSKLGVDETFEVIKEYVDKRLKNREA